MYKFLNASIVKRVYKPVSVIFTVKFNRFYVKNLISGSCTPHNVLVGQVQHRDRLVAVSALSEQVIFTIRICFTKE